MRYVYRPKHPQADEFGMVDAAIAGPKHASNEATHVITDEMSATRHMGDGNYYTSKRKFRQATKDAGCIEVGDQTHVIQRERKPITLDRRQRRDDIRRAIYELKNGRSGHS